MIIDGISVQAASGVTDDEIAKIITEEKVIWAQKGKELAAIFISIDGDELVVKTVEKSPITRTRRITGYLSTVDRFNDAKLAELNGRVSHI
ncbi:hypothetical protein SCACP_21170 [Sporomusa carbonis]|uniref:hypothetical protein n=1 Tax=Sporomusa carbonis TaxID=3076075 RepID=UPI003A7A4C36